MKISIPATSANLGPGFDALGLAISLHNHVKITPTTIASISIKGEGSDRVKLKTSNPFVTTFQDIFSRLTDKSENFRFEFDNAIPLSRGLGSSSAVIVGAIASAYKMAGLHVNKSQILNEALVYENHPDNIAPAVHGGFTVSIVEDKKVLTHKYDLPQSIQAVLVIPNRAMSTAKSRTQLPKNYSMSDCVNNLSRSAFLSSCFIQGKFEELKFGAKDMMHEARRMKQLPELFDVRQVAYEHGALMSTLSGSGSTFFNLTYKDDSKKLAEVLSEKFGEFKVIVRDFDNFGYQIRNS